MEIMRIGQLPDQIGGPHQVGLGIGGLMVIAVGNGKSVEFYGRMMRSVSMNGTSASRSRTKILPRST